MGFRIGKDQVPFRPGGSGLVDITGTGGTFSSRKISNKLGGFVYFHLHLVVVEKTISVWEEWVLSYYSFFVEEDVVPTRFWYSVSSHDMKTP